MGLEPTTTGLKVLQSILLQLLNLVTFIFRHSPGLYDTLYPQVTTGGFDPPSSWPFHQTRFHCATSLIWFQSSTVKFKDAFCLISLETFQVRISLETFQVCYPLPGLNWRLPPYKRGTLTNWVKRVWKRLKTFPGLLRDVGFEPTRAEAHRVLNPTP